MYRTQIYLRQDERDALRELAETMHVSMSELIRKAIDRFVAGSPRDLKSKVLKKSSGLWAKRDKSEFETIRSEFDRSR